ncbi:MAG TPA: hypothetical protein VMW38_27390 [Terriglobia bacterium]|nr:hypothetical protein [Terriglobia bacterium]
MEKVIRVVNLDYDSTADDLAYWLSRPSQERLEAVDLLRERVFELPSTIDKVLEAADLDFD